MEAAARDDLPASADAGPARQTLADEADEVDVWWGSYSPRTLLPEVVATFVLTAFLLGTGWYLRTRQELVMARPIAQSLVGLLWLFQLPRWIYLAVAADYRLTTRRLLTSWGFRRAEKQEVALPQIKQVFVTYRPLERLMGVGRIRVIVEGRSRPIQLVGVMHPEHIAIEIRKRVKRA